MIMVTYIIFVRFVASLYFQITIEYIYNVVLPNHLVNYFPINALEIIIFSISLVPSYISIIFASR